MSNLILRGVAVQDVSLYCNNEGKRVAEIKCRAAWSDTVCEEMGWAKEPLGFGNGSLNSSLGAISVILEPNSKGLKDYRIDITASKVDKFRHLAKTEEGETVTRQLEFVISTLAEDAALVLDKWLVNVGPSDSTAQCKINYNAKQQLKLVEPADGEDDKPRGRKRAEAAI